MRVRILCGSYVSTSPFIEGGCAYEWGESLEEPRELICPNWGQICYPGIVEWAILRLFAHVVFAAGCWHRAFTFSRRRREPYFNPDELPTDSEEAREPPKAC